MTDILLFGKDHLELDARLVCILSSINTTEATLNPDKNVVSKNVSNFLLSENKMASDPEKTQSLKK